MVVRRMARDLDIPVEVIGCPTIRETSRLAMSSRNQRLSERGLRIAAEKHRIMRTLVEVLENGSAFGALAAQARIDLLSAGFTDVEYIQLRCAKTLEPLTRAINPARLFVAAWVDGVRLIDKLPDSRA